MFFHVKQTLGFFVPGVVGKEDKDLYIGGHPEKRNFGNVVLGSFEIYIKTFNVFSPP